MNVLVTGGAGYIGSHAVKRLLAEGHGVTVVDNLFRGHTEAVARKAKFEKLDIRETEALTAILQRDGIDCVMHFAAMAYVGESVQQPLTYYENNTAGSISLLRAIDSAGVQRMVFSSTCATYGEPETMPITEDTPQRPVNPYGHSKLIVEQLLRDYANAHGEFGFVAPRYFNVAGCAADGSLGEDHEPETHIIPNILRAAMGLRDSVSIFGDDYPTPDGTCVRDYVHVEDLVEAHIVAMNALKAGDQRVYNIGIGKGISVRELIDSVRRVTGRDFEVTIAPRRAGDPPQLYADASRIRRELGWSAKYTQIDRIVETAWRWFKDHPRGYGG